MQRQAEPEQLNSDKPLAIKWEENCDLIHLSPSLSSLFACHLNNSTFGPLKISDRRHQATRAEMILSGTTAALLTEGWKLCSLNGTIQLRFYLAFLHFSPCTKWACRDLNLSPFSQEECTYFLKHSTVIWARAGEAKAGGSTMALQASGCKLKGMRQPNKSEQELLTTCLNIQDNTSILRRCPSLTALLTHSTPQTGYGRERETKNWVHLNTAAGTAKGRHPTFHSQVWSLLVPYNSFSLGFKWAHIPSKLPTRTYVLDPLHKWATMICRMHTHLREQPGRINLG